FPFAPAFSISAMIVLVRGASRASGSKTKRAPSCARTLYAERRASQRTFLGRSCLKFRLARGPNTLPPPRHCGARIEPCRARPVPFWRQGLLLPPETTARVLV